MMRPPAWQGRSPVAGNGMDGHVTGRFAGVLHSHHFQPGQALETTLRAHVPPCTRQLPRSGLGDKTPSRVMTGWHKLKPDLSWKRPYCLTGYGL
jgi:hypothetical protein